MESVVLIKWSDKSNVIAKGGLCQDIGGVENLTLMKMKEMAIIAQCEFKWYKCVFLFLEYRLLYY